MAHCTQAEMKALQAKLAAAEAKGGQGGITLAHQEALLKLEQQVGLGVFPDFHFSLALSAYQEAQVYLGWQVRCFL